MHDLNDRVLSAPADDQAAALLIDAGLQHRVFVQHVIHHVGKAGGVHEDVERP